MSEEKLIYFVRHGETDWNLGHRIQGRTDIALNELGTKQARCAAARLEKSSARTVYSSTLLRAANTAEIIAGSARNIVFWQELQEQDYGAWEGSTLAHVIDKYKDDYLRWKHFVSGAEITRGETEFQSFERARTILDKIAALPDKEIIVVTHGGILKIILIALFGINTKPMLWNYGFGNCSISAVKTDEKGNPSLLFLNDCLHISMQAKSETELMQKIRGLSLLPH